MLSSHKVDEPTTCILRVHRLLDEMISSATDDTNLTASTIKLHRFNVYRNALKTYETCFLSLLTAFSVVAILIHRSFSDLTEKESINNTLHCKIPLVLKKHRAII